MAILEMIFGNNIMRKEGKKHLKEAKKLIDLVYYITSVSYVNVLKESHEERKNEAIKYLNRTEQHLNIARASGIWTSFQEKRLKTGWERVGVTYPIIK